MKKFIFSLVALLAAAALFGEENVKFKGWKQAKTEHFNFIYEDASKEAAVEFAKIADDAWNKVAKIYGCPPDRLDVSVTARTNTINALTMYSPVSMGMYNTPFCDATFTFREDWKKIVFTHELIHAANIAFEDKETLKTLKLIFGELLTSLNKAEKGWALEGLTTVLETELTDGGRGRSPYYELNYKALTLDNSFMSYSDVGQGKEPPYDQAYVMGYLLMRSIADRYGIKALADIERNRELFGSWEDAVALVTGTTGFDLYNDVRVALAKKYADERKIPEGIVISPRAVGTSYYKPAYIDDEGNIIALRTATNSTSEVVKLTPSAKRGTAYIQDIKPEEDLNTVLKETILFRGNFSDQYCITAAKDGTVYAVLYEVRQDKMPGVQVKNFLYRWTEKDGLKKITKTADIFQPAVSADGKTLVAIEQNHLHMRIVKVDLETGAITPILEEEGIDFLQPALNADGSKLAFMRVDWKRGAVCVLDMNNIQNGYKVIYNGEGKITDPSTPNWNADGNLTFTDNARGRLESYEVTEEDGVQKITPVVADPIGVLWTYKNNKAIYYQTYSSTGFVLKVKPLTEWGVVPETEGPSPAGEIITFGKLENDYPDYVPYDIPSERRITEEENEANKKELLTRSISRNSKKDENKEPVAVRGKYIKEREEKYVKKAEEANTVKTELEDEKIYFKLPTRQLTLPMILPSAANGDNKETYFGVGLCSVFTTPLIQNNLGVGEAYFSYIPKLNNINGEIFFDFSVGNTELGIVAYRDIIGNGKGSDYECKEVNLFGLIDILPLYSNSTSTSYFGINEISNIYFILNRKDTSPISFDCDSPYYLDFMQSAGLSFTYMHVNYRKEIRRISFAVSEKGIIDSRKSKFFAGGTAQMNFRVPYKSIGSLDVTISGRYTDFPVDWRYSTSSGEYHEATTNYLYPGAVCVTAGYVLPSSGSFAGLMETKVFYSLRSYFGTNSVDGGTPLSGSSNNFTVPDYGMLGIGEIIKAGSVEMNLGVTVPVESISFDHMKFYYNITIGGISL